MSKRAYDSKVREKAAAATRARILRAAKALFAKRGIDAVTIADVAERAGVAASTVYASFKSKAGVLRALVEAAIFGPVYRAASARLDAEADPVDQVRMTASVARAIYEREAIELGLLRGASAYSLELRKLEQALEERRFAAQEARVKLLYAQKKAKPGLPLSRARRLMWMYTSREVYRMLVVEGDFTPEEYEVWLTETLVGALVAAEWRGAGR